MLARQAGHQPLENFAAGAIAIVPPDAEWLPIEVPEQGVEIVGNDIGGRADRGQSLSRGRAVTFPTPKPAMACETGRATMRHMLRSKSLWMVGGALVIGLGLATARALRFDIDVDPWSDDMLGV
jgi:hypothetical protein